MTTGNTVSVVGKSSQNIRVCISIDEKLFSYFAKHCEGEAKARDRIRDWIATLDNVNSKAIRDLIYKKVVKPGLQTP